MNHIVLRRYTGLFPYNDILLSSLAIWSACELSGRVDMEFSESFGGKS